MRRRLLSALAAGARLCHGVTSSSAAPPRLALKWRPPPLQRVSGFTTLRRPPVAVPRLPAPGDVWRVIERTAPFAARRFAASSQAPAASRALADAANALGGARSAAQSAAERFWHQHSLKVYAAGGAVVVLGIWRSMLWVASSTVAVSESLASWGLFFMAAGVTALGATYISWRRTLSPNAVFRQALRKLSASRAVETTLGLPLRTSETRAFVLSGGNLRVKGYMPRWRRSRCHILFPVSGPLGRGLVSAEAKKVGGEYVFKLLALDVAPSGASTRQMETRVFVIGDDSVYAKHAILSELRDPLIATLAAEPAHEAEDDTETGSEAAPPPSLPAGTSPASQSSSSDEDPYAWDYLKEYLRRKRAAQGHGA